MMEEIDGYKIVKKISSNSIFDTYEAVDLATSDSVLIKKTSLTFLSENEDMARIVIKEHEISKYFSKKNIIAKSKIKENEFSEYLIYFLESFELLQEYIVEKVRDYDYIYSLAISMAQSLEIIHAKGLGHYNITPETILINKESKKVKLINLCVYPRFDILCNVLYIAPEQTGRLSVNVDFRADFYSLGIILYQMVTGIHPITNENSKIVYRRQITDRFPAPDSLDITIPTALSKIIYKLTSKQASNRYQNATSLKFDLVQGQKVLKTSPHETFPLGGFDYISKIVFPEINSFFEREKEEIISSIKYFERNKITIINLSGTLSQGKDDFTRDILNSLDKGKIFNITITALLSTSSIPYYSVSNILNETVYNIFNSELFDRKDVVDFFESLSNQHFISLHKLCPSISSLFKINIKQKNEMINDYSVLHSAVRQLINFISKRTRPFVIYVENIENMDNSSMRLFIELLSDKNLTDLVVIHSTINSVSLSRSIHNQNINFIQFEIPRLGKRKIASLFNKLFKTSDEESSTVIDIFIDKTHGKVKQIYTLIEILIENKQIYFDNQKYKWHFEIEKIREFDIQLTYDVYIENQFKLLDESTKKLLIECSLIGFVFDLRLLQHSHDYNIRSLSVLFHDIKKNGFIEPIERFSTLNNSNNPLLYKFKNTKVHSLIFEKITLEYYQNCINLFSGIIEICKSEEAAFFFFEEFIKKNQTLLSELSTDDRNIMLLYYFQKAETFYFLRKFKDADIIINYCVSLVKPESWSNTFYNITKSIFHLAMKTSIQIFNFSKADQYFTLIKKRITDPIEKIPFYELQIDSLKARGKNQEAQNEIEELLKIVRVFPKKPTSIFWKISSNTTKLLFYKNVSKNNLPTLKHSNSTRKKTLSFINHRVDNVDKHLCDYTLYKIFKDSILNGIDKQYIFPLLRHSRSLIQNPKTFEKGINLSQTLIKIMLIQECDFENELHYYFKHLLPFSNHDLMFNQNEIIDKHFSNGEISKAIELAQVHFSIDFFKGINLNRLLSNIQQTINKIGDSTKKNELISILNIIELRTKLLTQTRKKNDENDENSLLIFENASGNLANRWNNITLLLYFFLSGDFEKAKICAHNVLHSKDISEDSISHCIVQFYDSLISCETYNTETISEQKIIFETLGERLQYFKTLSKYNPNNFLHNYLILQAEFYNITNKSNNAIETYLEAISCCDKQNLHHMCGYIHKRLASIYEHQNEKTKAINHYIKAFNYYKFWGTETIANKIKFEHFSIFDELEIRIYNIS